MAFSFSNCAHQPARRPLRPATIARRCVGGLISLAGAAILGMELVTRIAGAMG